MYSLNIEIRCVGFHESPILNKNRILIPCLDENLDKATRSCTLIFSCFLAFGVAGLYFPWNVRRADLDAIWKCLR